jgi:hypothetical protein
MPRIHQLSAIVYDSFLESTLSLTNSASSASFNSLGYSVVSATIVTSGTGVTFYAQTSVASTGPWTTLTPLVTPTNASAAPIASTTGGIETLVVDFNMKSPNNLQYLRIVTNTAGAQWFPVWAASNPEQWPVAQSVNPVSY